MYEIGNSTETTRQNVVKHKEIALEFLDIERAFNRTSFDVITLVAKKHGICRWISSMLESRNIKTESPGETARAPATRGCPQDLWCEAWSWKIFCGA
jgi:hypothetical protein